MKRSISWMHSVIPSRKTIKKSFRVFVVLLVVFIVLEKGGIVEVPLATRTLEQHQPGMYRVVRVDDGDTLSVIRSGQVDQVRMLGVDTPEIHHPDKPVQCYGREATRYTRSLIGDKVRLVADPLDDNRDIYGRLLRYVYTPEGTHINAEIIANGYGFAYTRFRFEQRRHFMALQDTARSNDHGLWGSCEITEDEFGTPQTAPAAT